MSTDDALFRIKELMVLGGDATFLQEHPWFSEETRWAEFVFALLTQTTQLHESHVRWLTQCLLQLDLLSVPDLAECEPTDTTASPGSLIVSFLEDHAVPIDAARRSFGALVDVSRALALNYNGKIQVALRKHGEVLLSEFTSAFATQYVDDDQLRYAVTLWMQNALNMPTPLEDEWTTRFCVRHDLERDALISAADELDLNVAVLDDLIHHYEAEVDRDQQFRRAETD